MKAGHIEKSPYEQGGSKKAAPPDYLSPSTASKFSGLLTSDFLEIQRNREWGFGDCKIRSWDEKSIKGVAFLKVWAQVGPTELDCTRSFW